MTAFGINLYNIACFINIGINKSIHEFQFIQEIDGPAVILNRYGIFTLNDSGSTKYRFALPSLIIRSVPLWVMPQPS